MLSVIMLNVVNAECLKYALYAECRYAECRYTEWSVMAPFKHHFNSLKENDRLKL